MDFNTALLWERTNKGFCEKVKLFKGLGIEKYKEIATKQGAGWKILKSLDKGKEFSDNISVSFDEDPVEVCNPDGSKDII